MGERHFHNSGFAGIPVLTQRRRATKKWPILASHKCKLPRKCHKIILTYLSIYLPHRALHASSISELFALPLHLLKTSSLHFPAVLSKYERGCSPLQGPSVLGRWQISLVAWQVSRISKLFALPLHPHRRGNLCILQLFGQNRRVETLLCKDPVFFVINGVH